MGSQKSGGSFYGGTDCANQHLLNLARFGCPLIFKILLLCGKTSGKYYQKLSAQHRRERDEIAAKVKTEICYTGVQRVYLTDFVPILVVIL